MNEAAAGCSRRRCLWRKYDRADARSWGNGSVARTTVGRGRGGMSSFRANMWPSPRPGQRDRQPMGDEQSRPLVDVQGAVKPHARYRLQAGRQEVDRHRPYMKAQLGTFQDSSCLRAEPLSTFLLAAAILHVERSTVRTCNPVLLAPLHEPCFGRGVVHGHAAQLDYAGAFAVGVSGCLVAHVFLLICDQNSRECQKNQPLIAQFRYRFFS